MESRRNGPQLSSRHDDDDDVAKDTECKSVCVLITVDLQPLDLDNIFLFRDKMYSPAQAYKNARAANLLFAYELARRLQDSAVKVYAICPGQPVSAATVSLCFLQAGVMAVTHGQENCARNLRKFLASNFRSS